MSRRDSKTLLDRFAKNDFTFLQSWEISQFSKMERRIADHFSDRYILTLHGNYPPGNRSFHELAVIMGFAYTSSSLYAGYWVCNTDVYDERYPGYHYNVFAIGIDGNYYAVLKDNNENEIVIAVNRRI